MSTTTIHVFNANGIRDYSRDVRYSNGWTAPVLWRTLWQKYLAERGTPNSFSTRGCYIGSDGFETLPMQGPLMGELCKLHEDPRLAWFERVALRSTFDHVVVRRGDFIRVAEAFDAFTVAHVAPDAKHVWHVPAYAKLLRELANDETVSAVGWTQTSVSDMFRSRRRTEDELAEDELAESEPYNLNTRDEHFVMELVGEEARVLIDAGIVRPNPNVE